MLVTASSGCLFYPDSSERSNDDIVITSHAPKADFKSFKTFAIDPDVMMMEAKADGSIESTPIDPAASEKIVQRLTDHMERRGYTKTDSKDEADLGITVTAISGIVIGTSYWGGYYGWYWGYPGYGYYYPYPVYYSYETGSLIVDMVDLDKAREDFPRPDAPVMGTTGDDGADAGTGENPGPGGLAVVWGMAGYRAFAESSKSVQGQNALNAIDQAFTQSPYLKAE